MKYWHVVVICDPDRQFSHKLEDTLRSYFCTLDAKEGKTHRRSFRIVSSENGLRSYLRHREADLFIVNEKYYPGYLLFPENTDAVVLKTTDVPFGNPDMFINRNAGLTNICKEIVSMGEVITICRTEVICVYSPMGCRAQSTFAYFLARNLAKDHRVLYLSLMQNRESAYPVASPGEEDFKDLMNVMDRDTVLFRNKVKRMMCRQGNMYYLSPGISVKSLIRYDSEKWHRFLEYFRSGKEFDYIIIEATDYLKGVSGLLRTCERVYMLEATMDSGPESMKMRDYGILLGTRAVFLPNTLRHFMLCEMADFVRKTVRNEAI